MSVESPRARQAWAGYVALGPGRSLEQLAQAYQSRTGSVPTRQLSRLKEWSAEYGWQARLQAIADQEAAAAEDAQRALVREVLETGFGLAHERVRALKELGDVLLEELRDPQRRWVTEQKWLGSSEAGQLVDIERFNHHEVEQFRGILDDIAKEVGGRIRKAELTGKDGGPIEVEQRESVLSEEDRDRRILAIVERARARADRASATAEPDLGATAGPTD